ncbi:MAG TPA: SUF system NifU family Fe-S cluster assembly protein [Methylomirabilota bacterium]|nr:SUF system NifU family Fe-S cluster assembly protein [Methylomirabilota bacterium]
MSDLRELYQEVILDHSRQPRNFRRPAGANREARGDNPLCGDKVTVFLTIEDGRVKDVGFEGRGCAISMASASLMTEVLKGKTEAEARTLFERFHDEMTGKSACHGAAAGELDKLTVLSGVREYPMRVKCATLSWHTLMAALNDRHDRISTEGPGEE